MAEEADVRLFALGKAEALMGCRDSGGPQIDALLARGFGIESMDEPPPFSSSVDAALTLMKGPFVVSSAYMGMGDWRYFVRCGTGTNFNLLFYGEHPMSMPMAICIAAVKAEIGSNLRDKRAGDPGDRS